MEQIRNAQIFQVDHLSKFRPYGEEYEVLEFFSM